jgi:predicted nucleic acid-binding protein
MKYLFDSDAFFESARRRGNPKVKRWVATLVPAQVYLCPILVAEYVRGVQLLPPGPDRVRELRFLLRALRTFEWAVLDVRAVSRFATARNHLPKGVTVPDNDTWKAALAMRHGLTLVTGNGRHFQHFPVQILNPF